MHDTVHDFQFNDLKKLIAYLDSTLAILSKFHINILKNVTYYNLRRYFGVEQNKKTGVTFKQFL